MKSEDIAELKAYKYKLNMLLESKSRVIENTKKLKSILDVWKVENEDYRNTHRPVVNKFITKCEDDIENFKEISSTFGFLIEPFYPPFPDNNNTPEERICNIDSYLTYTEIALISIDPHERLSKLMIINNNIKSLNSNKRKMDIEIIINSLNTLMKVLRENQSEIIQRNSYTIKHTNEFYRKATFLHHDLYTQKGMTFTNHDNLDQILQEQRNIDIAIKYAPEKCIASIKENNKTTKKSTQRSLDDIMKSTPVEIFGYIAKLSKETSYEIKPTEKNKNDTGEKLKAISINKTKKVKL